MKKFLIFPLLLLIFPVFGQLHFEELSFNDALKKAKQASKLVFVQFESAGCNQCNEVADKKLGETLGQSFICIKIKDNSPDRNQVSDRYNKSFSGFGSMFINADGTLIHTYPGSTTNTKKYEEHIDQALFKAGEGIRVNELEKQYREGNKNPALVELLLETKRSLNLETDSLLEEYVAQLPADSLKSPRTIAFIYTMSPLVNSNAFKLMRKDYAVFLKAWEMSSVTERSKANNITGSKSMKKAIAAKDLNYARDVALYMGRIYSSKPTYAQNVYESQMLDYYKGTNDTLNYLGYASTYYDKFYMTISVDSIKRQDTINAKAVFEKSPQTTEKRGDSLIKKRTVAYASITQFYMHALSSAAVDFYMMTNKMPYLEKALNWASRAREFFETYNSMNIYALLLYKNGKTTEAIDWQTKAIALKKKQGFPTTELEKQLLDMKEGRVIIMLQQP